MHHLKLVEIKKSFGFLQSSPQILAEWVEPIYLIKKSVLGVSGICDAISINKMKKNICMNISKGADKISPQTKKLGNTF